ncbi:MAG: glycosyltransferase family 2 protein [bacterium]
MYKQKSIGVVIPAYNEEKLIGGVIETIPDFIDKIIVVNDQSSDQTKTIVIDYQRQFPDRIVYLEHTVNQGVGGAISTGYTWCRDNELDIAVVMAGDGQMDPLDLPNLLDPIIENRADYTKGNRLFTGKAWQLIPKIRYLGNSALSLLTKIVSGYWNVADSQSGYTAINRRALMTIDWDFMYKRYGQPNDLLVRLNIFDFRVLDVPIRPIYNIGEKSGIKPIRLIPKLLWLLSRLFIFRMIQKYVIRNFHPLIFFYFMGLTLFIPGLLFGSYLLLYRMFCGPVSPTSALFAVFLFVSGLQSIFFAMWFDMEHNREVRGH